MKDKHYLLKTFENKITKSEIIGLAESAGSDFLVGELLELTISAKHPSAAFRSAWLLETILILYPAKFLPYTDQFFNLYPQQSNPGCQRHFTKIMMLCLKNSEFVPENAEHIFDQIVETTFDWLAGESPVAVKANCMDVLYLLQRRNRWIKEELNAQIEFLMRDGSPAIQSRGKRLLRRIMHSNNIIE
ncbi:MAG TPA: hypothetical protein VGD22_14795 [Sphingobacteriaceae bacterium]